MVNKTPKYLIGRALVKVMCLKGFSYSSLNEDNILDWLTGYKEKGVYIDIGAYNPDHINNTKLFYQRGWRGINIEPNEEGFKKFLEKRPEDVNLNCAVGLGEADYYFAEGGSGNTFVKNTAEQRGIDKKIKVKLKPLSEIFKENNLSVVDFISMDVENFEHEVIKSNDWFKYKAKVLCLEGSGYPELKKYGYKLVFWDGGNSYFKLDL
jgi:FkbM family methyltransferase